MASQVEVAQVVAMIGSAYPNFSPTKETVMVYYELLKDLPADLLKAATLQCSAESGRKFAPSVGEIRGAAEYLNRKSQGIPSTLEAWDETCKAPYRDYKNYPLYSGGQIFYEDPDPYKWSHPIVERVAKLLGWPRFPNPSNESVDRAHFFRQYEIEVENFTNRTIEIPEVTRYLDAARSGLSLPAGNQIKQLTERLSK